MSILIELFQNYYVKIAIRTCIILIIAYIIDKILCKRFKSDKVKKLIHINFIKNALRGLLWIVAITSIANQFETFSNIAGTVLAGSGIAAAIIGLAAQESFANIFSGLFISIFKPFNIGDRIRIVGDDTAGFVEDITLRHTVIRTYMNVTIIIPNSVIGSSKIENTSYVKGASYPIEITIAYEDINKRHRAMEIMEEVVTSHPLFYDKRTPDQISAGFKATECLCINTAESGITLKILVWTEYITDNAKVCSDCRMEIIDRFEKEGIEIPYNKVVVINN